MDKCRKLIQLCIELLRELRDLTPGRGAEEWLNRTYGPTSDTYRELATMIRNGVEEGWAANGEVHGRRYRRSQLCPPSDETLHFSITAVYIDSMACSEAAQESFRGDYHGHPYGEFNLIVPLHEGAQLAGPNGWCHAGWTAPPPGSHHYPEVRGGAVIALFFLPAGRISYVAPPIQAMNEPI